MKYKQVGTIQLLRGNRFVISLDEHRLPEGTRAIYIRESDELQVCDFGDDATSRWESEGRGLQHPLP